MPGNLPAAERARLKEARVSKGLRRLRPGMVIMHFVRRSDGARERYAGPPHAAIAAANRLLADGFEPATRRQWLEGAGQ